MIEAGIYKARAVKGSLQHGFTSNGTEQAAVDLVLATGDRVTAFLYFSEKAKAWSIDRLKALGCTDMLTGDGIDANEVSVGISYEEYQGEQKMKVNIMTGGSVKLDRPMDDRQKKAFAASINAALKASGNGNPARKPAAPPPESEDEIPF